MKHDRIKELETVMGTKIVGVELLEDGKTEEGMKRVGYLKWK